MNVFEKKYGFKETVAVQGFHRSRRMFCIYDGTLRIAPPCVPYSHATWFEQEGWISVTGDNKMDMIVRGVVDKRGDVYFYVGYDFTVTDVAEKEFFCHLKELVERLVLSADKMIYGGMIKKEAGTLWPPRKEYGQIKDHL